MEDFIELTRRKERLIARADAQRRELAAAFRDLERPIAAVDRAMAAGRFLRAHPVLVAAIIAALIVFRRRSLMGLAARGLAAWRTWRAVAPWLAGIGRGLRRSRVPGER